MKKDNKRLKDKKHKKYEKKFKRITVFFSRNNQCEDHEVVKQEDDCQTQVIV